MDRHVTYLLAGLVVDGVIKNEDRRVRRYRIESFAAAVVHGEV